METSTVTDRISSIKRVTLTSNKTDETLRMHA